MDNLFIAAACLLAGLLLHRTGRMPEGADRALAGVVIQISAPAVAFLAARGMPLTLEILLPGSMAWIVFAGGLAFFGLARRLFGFSRQTFACLMLSAALCNTIFIGLPMVEAFFGPQYAYVAFLCDNPGTSLVLALPGVLLATHFSGRAEHLAGVSAGVSAGISARVSLSARLWPSLRRVLAFPPLQAMLLGLALRSVELPAWLLAGLGRIGATLVPLALLSVGLGMRFRLPGGSAKALAYGLAFKLAVAPALMWLVSALVLGNTGMVARVTVFEAAMPPMILGAILATDHKLDPDLAALLVGIGTPLSFLTLPLWRLALNWM